MIRRKKGKIALILSTTFLLQIGNYSVTTPRADNNRKTNYVMIDPSIQYQKFEGWGTSLCWWANMVGDWDMTDPNDTEGRTKREVLSELIFDEDKGLGINIVRYNIGGGDNPNKEEHPEHLARIEGNVPGYKETADSEYNWEADKAQLGILEDAKNIVGNEELQVEVFSNSPPWYMTQSGCNTGNFDASKDNLRADQYEEFAQYLSDVTEYINNEKEIEVDYLEPVNEPASDYWGANSTKQEGSHFEQGTSQSKIIEEVQKHLKNKGLSGNIKLTGTDETSIDVQIESIKKLSEEALSSISKINTHAYGGSKRGELRDLAYTLDKKLWMSEVCVSNADHNHDDVVSALELSDIILDDLNKLNAEAWIVWQAVESEAENYLWNNNYGLIHGMYETEDDLLEDYHIKNGLTAEVMEKEGLERGGYFLTKQYYVFGQFSKFIRPGYTIIDTDNDDVVAAMSPEGDEIVVVVENNSEKDNDFSFVLDKTSAKDIKAYRTSASESLDEVSDFNLDENMISSNIPANSIETFVISTEAYNKGTVNIVNDGVLGSDLNKFNYSDGWSIQKGQVGSYTSDTHLTTAVGSKMSFKFNGSRVKVLGTKSLEGGEFKVYVDSEEYGEFSSYDVSELEGETLVDVKDLEDKEHVIELVLMNEGKRLEVDCAYIINGDISSNNTKPIISSINSWGNRMTLTIRAIEEAEKYRVYYVNSEGKSEVKEYASNKNIVIDDLELNKEYTVYATAVVNGKETEKSNETSIKTKIVNNSNVLYYVDCGDPTVNVVEQSGEEFGLRNSIEDQSFGVDASSGYKWGYTSTNGTWSNNEYDRFMSVRCDTSDEPGGNITYKFELDNSNYRVVLGFRDPWNNSDRYMDIIVEDEVKETRYKTAKDTNDTKMYENIEVKDGMLEVTVKRSDGVTGGSADPHISWILIEGMNNKSIVNVGSLDKVITQVGTKPELPESIEVEYTDGTKGVEVIDWDEVPQDILSSEFTYTTVTGNVNGNVVKTNLFVLPKKLIYFAQCGGTEDSNLFYEVQDKYDILNNEMDKVFEEGSWGYIETDPKTGTYAVSDIFNSVRYANTDELNYKFNLEDGKYKIALGFMDPWGNYERTSDININGVEVDKSVVITTSPMIKIYDNITVEDGIADIKILKNPGTSQQPIVSFIMISQINEEVNPEPEVVPVEGISLNKTKAELVVGEKMNLVATVNPDNATNSEVIWSSSDDNIATVDSDGNISAKNAGKANIIVTTVDGEFTATCELTISEKQVIINSEPKIDASDVEITVGEKFNPMKNVTATDNEDGDITNSIKIIENTVDINKEGIYIVIYSVKDSNGLTVTKEIKVVVKAKSIVVEEDVTSKPDANNNNNKIPQTGNVFGIISVLLAVTSLGGGAFILKKKNK